MERRDAEPLGLELCKAAFQVGDKEYPSHGRGSAQLCREHCQMQGPLVNPRAHGMGQGASPLPAPGSPGICGADSGILKGCPDPGRQEILLVCFKFRQERRLSAPAPEAKPILGVQELKAGHEGLSE